MKISTVFGVLFLMAVLLPPSLSAAPYDTIRVSDGGVTWSQNSNEFHQAPGGGWSGGGYVWELFRRVICVIFGTVEECFNAALTRYAECLEWAWSLPDGDHRDAHCWNVPNAIACCDMKLNDWEWICMIFCDCCPGNWQSECGWDAWNYHMGCESSWDEFFPD